MEEYPHIQQLIQEQCMPQFMCVQQTSLHLFAQHCISPALTLRVWSAMEISYPQFFRWYYLAVRARDQRQLMQI